MRTASWLLVFALCVLIVEGSHNRGGFISWKLTGPRTVSFSFTHAWRAGATDAIGVNYGDGQTQTFQPNNQIFSGTDLAGEGYLVFTNTATHTYGGTATQFTVYWSSCCRVGSLLVGANGNFLVQTIVDLSGGHDSPVSSLPPLIQLPISSAATYQIGVADPDGLPFTCRFATSGESGFSGYPTIGSNALSVSSGCLLSWNTLGGTSGSKYAVSIVVKQGGTGTTIPLDFIIELVTAAALPTCQVIANSQVASVGQLWEVDVVGTSTAVSSLVVSALNLAPGATLNPTAGSSGAVPFTVRLSVVPQASGAYSSVIVFTDANHRSASCSVTYQVADATNCALVKYDSCSVSSGITTYALSSTNPGDSFSWSSDCVGTFDSTTTSSVTFHTATNPGNTCHFSVDITVNGVTARCTADASCPRCTGTPSPKCRADQPATHVVNDPASVDAYLLGDVLAVISDPDGAIVSSTSSTPLPPGVALTANGQFVVSDTSLLESGTYSITVTTTDVYGGTTTQVVTLVLLDIACGAGLQSCGRACYNPDVHDCLIFNGKRHLCLNGNLICNLQDQCCYDPAVEVCIDGGLCPKGYQKCAGTCFDPVARDCLTDTNGNEKMCLKGFQLCGDSCYDPAAHSCHAGVLCQRNEQVCAGGCFDPAVLDCVNNVLLPEGWLTCGQANYNPAVHTCMNGHELCPVGLSLCKTACYHPSVYDCDANFELIPHGLERCGAGFYNDEEYDCCNQNTGRLCLVGQNCAC